MVGEELRDELRAALLALEESVGRGKLSHEVVQRLRLTFNEFLAAHEQRLDADHDLLERIRAALDSLRVHGEGGYGATAPGGRPTHP